MMRIEGVQACVIVLPQIWNIRFQLRYRLNLNCSFGSAPKMKGD